MFSQNCASDKPHENYSLGLHMNACIYLFLRLFELLRDLLRGTYFHVLHVLGWFFVSGIQFRLDRYNDPCFCQVCVCVSVCVCVCVCVNGLYMKRSANKSLPV